VIENGASPIYKQITNTPEMEINLLWSPDGKYAAIDRNIDGIWGGNWEIYIIKNIQDVIMKDAPLDLVQITNAPSVDCPAGFSKDSKRLLFSSAPEKSSFNYKPWIVNNIQEVINGASPELVSLTSPPFPETVEGFSPDMTKLLFGSERAGHNSTSAPWNEDIWIGDYLYDDSAFPGANITYPILNQVISGKVEIKGLAKDNISVDGETLLSRLLSYTVGYGVGENPTSWKAITASNIQIDNGILATWDTASLPNGTYTIRLTATDGKDSNIQSLTVIVKNLQGFFDNFDDGKPDGWEATGLWHLEKKRCHSSPYSFAYNNGTNYNTGARNSGYIISPEIDLTSATSAKLSFWTFWQHESYPSGSYDNMRVEVFNGTSWNQIFYNDCKGLSYSDWHQEIFDLSGYCGKKIKIRFSFDTVDALYNNYEGWYIDDVNVEASSEAPPPPIFSEDFDDGDTQGWGLSGLWHISDKRSDTPKYSIAYNNGTNYDVGRTYGDAISPVIDLSKENNAVLSFKSWYETEYTGTYWDRKVVYISTEDTNYTNWTQIAQVSGTMRQWQAYTANLTPYCKKKVKIRFWFDTIDSILNNYEGWYIDSIEIKKESGQGISSLSQSAFSHILSLLDRRTSSFLKLVDNLPPFEALMAEKVSSSLNEIKVEREERAKSALCFFDSDAKYALSGNLIEEEIWINTQEDLLGGELTIAFEKEKIEIKDVKEGSIFSNPKGFYLLNNEEGILRVQIVGDGSTKDKASLFLIRFYVKSLPATIKIQKADLRDNLNHKIETKIEDLTIEGITLSELLQSYPNPAEDSCYIPFQLRVNSDECIVNIYNILGQKVRTIDAGPKKAGSYTKQDRAIFWNLTNDKGQKVAKGLYYIRLKAGGFTATKAMVVR
jgi:hypothetical protein